jgi:hypothetical protein
MRKQTFVRHICAFVTLICIVTACGKKNSPAPSNPTTTTPPTTTPPVTTSGCKLTQQGINYGSSSQLYKLEYDASGNPSKITSYNTGVLAMTENIQPDYLQFIEGGSNALFQGIKFDTHFYDKAPGTYFVNSAETALTSAGRYTYDGKLRLSTIKGGIAENGALVDSLATTITFTYDANNNVRDIIYTYRNNVVRTFTAKGYDDHDTPYKNIKNSWFLQYEFIIFSTELDNPRFLFDHLSAHNLLGFVSQEADTPDFSYTETYTYTYNDKGQPSERKVSAGATGQTPDKGFTDSYTYNCN